MITFFTTLLRLFLQAFRSKRNTLTENALLKKENEILARKMGKKRVHFNIYDKLFFVVLNRANNIKQLLMYEIALGQEPRGSGVHPAQRRWDPEKRKSRDPTKRDGFAERPANKEGSLFFLDFPSTTIASPAQSSLQEFLRT